MIARLALLGAQTLYLFAPLLLSAAISGLVMRMDWLRPLRRPIDAGCKVRGKRLLGDSKTWRGVFVAVVGSILGVAIQKYAIGARAGALARVDYAHINALAFGAALGFGAMLGELPNSFVKRRLNIPPGQTTQGWLSIVFYLWDQLDLLTLTWPLLCLWIRPRFDMIAASVLITLLLHPLSSLIGYAMGARRSAR